ncbi:MAG: hypothetical protein KIT56_04940 [Gammaproteobacteria bacterium]|nr:hypothetical protein [Gammaproteobacteria bacterium]MCW5583224.1 hypothetical protein [Gammaproteobacteria bacterium]
MQTRSDAPAPVDLMTEDEINHSCLLPVDEETNLADNHAHSNTDELPSNHLTEEEVLPHEINLNNHHEDNDICTPSPKDIEIGTAESQDERDENKTPDSYDNCCAIAKPFRPLLYIGPVSVALTEAADIGRSLYTSDTTSLYIVLTASIAAFVSSLGLTGETTIENFNETCDTIKNRALPHDWPKLPKNKEIAAIGLSILPAVWGPISEGMQAYFFVSGIPSEYQFSNKVNPNLWSAISGGIATGAGLTTTLTESAEMYKVVREKLAGTSTPYQNTISRFVSPWFGGSLGALKSLQDSIQGYIAIKSIFNISSTSGKVLIGLPSLVNTVPNFCFAGMFNINALDEFFGYTQQSIQNRKVETIKIAAFSISLGIAVYLAYWKTALNKSFYHDVTSDFGLEADVVPEQAYEALTWAMFVQESMQATAALFQPTHNLLHGVTSKISQGCQSIYRFFCPPSTDKVDEKKPLLEEEPVLLSDEEEARTSPSLIINDSSYGESDEDNVFAPEAANYSPTLLGGWGNTPNTRQGNSVGVNGVSSRNNSYSSSAPLF